MNRGKIQEFLAIVLDFTKKKECHVLQVEHLRDIISLWPEKYDKTNINLTISTSFLCIFSQNKPFKDKRYTLTAIKFYQF